MRTLIIRPRSIFPDDRRQINQYYFVMHLVECEAMLTQLEMLSTATVIQSHVRRWLARSSYSRTRESSICIQAFIQMAIQANSHQCDPNSRMCQGMARTKEPANNCNSIACPSMACSFLILSHTGVNHLYPSFPPDEIAEDAIQSNSDQCDPNPRNCQGMARAEEPARCPNCKITLA